MVERVFHVIRDDGHEIEVHDLGDRMVGSINGTQLVVGRYTPDNVSEFRSQLVYARGFLDGYLAGQSGRRPRRKT